VTHSATTSPSPTATFAYELVAYGAGEPPLSPVGGAAVFDASNGGAPLNTADPGVVLLTIGASLVVGVTVKSPAFRGAVPFPLKALAVGLQCPHAGQLAVSVGAWVVDGARFAASWRFPGSAIQTRIDVTPGYGVYIIALPASPPQWLASDQFTAVALRFHNSSVCTVPVVSDSMVSAGARLPPWSAPDFALSSVGWVLCNSSTATLRACGNGTTTELTGVPVLAAYADIELCPTALAWRGWPQGVNELSSSVSSLARYLPARCRARGIDITAILLFAVNSAIMAGWFCALLFSVSGCMGGMRTDAGSSAQEWLLLLGMCLCVLDQVTDALWFLLTDWEVKYIAIERASFALLILNQLVFSTRGAWELVSYYAPHVVLWLYSVFEPCGLGGVSFKKLARRCAAVVKARGPRKYAGVYRLLFNEHQQLHIFLIEVVWVSVVVAITPALLMVQSALYTTQLMALVSVAKGWSRVMGIPLYPKSLQGNEKTGINARRFDVWAWNVSRLAELAFESLPSFVVQAVALYLDRLDGSPPSGIAVASFSLSTYMLLGHIWHYGWVYVYTRTAPWLLDPTEDYAKLWRLRNPKRSWSLSSDRIVAAEALATVRDAKATAVPLPNAPPAEGGRSHLYMHPAAKELLTPAPRRSGPARDCEDPAAQNTLGRDAGPPHVTGV
jgi:hypothetical protein